MVVIFQVTQLAEIGEAEKDVVIVHKYNMWVYIV
jgi:hypothetical protein